MKQGTQSLKRLLSFIMAFAMVLTMLPMTTLAADTDTTVYLVPNSNWTQANARFAIYCFGNGETWVDMSDADGDGMYEGVVPAGYPSIIFCRMNPSATANDWTNKWNQSADLTLPTDGTNCYTVAEGTWDAGGGTWSTVTPEPEEEETNYTVYFINSTNWTEVYAYAWTDGGAGLSWPGNAMTKTGVTVNGFDIYSISFDTEYANIIFNNKGQGSQTGNLTLNVGQYYDCKGSTWYASLDDVPEIDPLATDAYLVGDFNSWNTSANQFRLPEAGATAGTVSLELEANTTYEFKVVDSNSWLGNGGSITGSVNGWVFSSSASDNCKMKTAEAGTYIFTWDTTNKMLSVAYPAGESEEATYIIAGTAELCGSAWDVANTANKMTLNTETGLYEKTYESVPKGTHSFKVTDGTWDKAWGNGDDADGNTVFTLDAISDVTITFNMADYETKVTAVPTGEVEEPTGPVTDVTIHYRNSGLWGDVYYHAWIENGDNDTGLTTWPGTKVTENSGATNWYTVKLTELNAENGIGIIFNNNNGGQTGDIMITKNGEYWYDGSLQTEAPATWPDGSVPTETYEVTLHFADAKNWGTVNLYTWTAAGTPTGSWPGTACGLDADGFYSLSLTYEAPEGQGLNFIFNGGGAQTVDLALNASDFVNNKAEKWVVPTTTDTEGKYYADIVDSPDAIAISPVVEGTTVTFAYKGETTDTVEVRGTMNNWASGYAMTCNEYGVWSVTINNVPYGIQQYKLLVNGSWILDPLNSFVITEDNGNQNSAFLISNPELDNNEVKINVHYDAPSAEWNVCAWGAPNLESQYDFVDGVTTITLNGRKSQYVAFKVRKSVEGNDWAEQSGEIRIDLGKIVSGTIDVYVGSDFSVKQNLNDDVVYANKISSVEYDYDNNTITVKTGESVADAETAFAIFKDGAAAGIIDTITASGSTYTLTLTQQMDLVTLYQYTLRFSEQVKFTDKDYVIGINTVYASERFGNEFTYDGELGVNMTKDETRFRLWAPTAEAVTLNLYIYGSAAEDEEFGQDEQYLTWTHEMKPIEKGVWEFVLDFDITHLMYYYTYDVTVNGKTEIDVVDPYARSAGVNGERGAFFDMSSTDPAGWDADKNPNPITSYTDAVIYELHVRDFSIDESSGVSEANRGKYLAFTEKGTTTAGGAVTGIDYLQDLGVTHLHLLPVYDYGSVDETKCENFNWGYDPVNYNVPEGSYSTNPYDATVRVKEFKQMVMALHEADISVIMDVVYNHVYDAGKFSMNRIVPNYFSRVNADGSFSNGSGCGNDTASEREMVRKYIVESVLYWHQEYHIDGFRFDLVGLLDGDTINQIVEEVHACCPDVIFYGEGWTLGTAVEPGNTMATQANSAYTPEFAYFSDTIRNLLAGSNGSSLGFVSGATGQEEAIRDNFMAMPWWTKNPAQIVQYASCHDNYTLIDKLILSTGKSGIDADIIKMNNLAAAIYMTSQGIPFIHAGEEFLREKLEEDGGRCENSYNASDYVNHIEWSNLENETYASNSDYYKGLIAFRKAHEALRMETNAEITANIDYTWVTNEVVMFTIDGAAAGDISDSIVVIFNATNSAKTVTLPEGAWSVCIDAENAGIETLKTVTGSVSVDGISAMVLVQGDVMAKIGDELYETLTDAVADVAAGETITLVNDVVEEEPVVIAQNVTLDLNGRTLTGTIQVKLGAAPMALDDAAEAVTISNGTIINEDADKSAIESSGTLILENMTIESAGHVITVNDGTVTIHSGTYTAGEGAQVINKAAVDSVVNIDGGTFSQDPSEYVVPGYVAVDNGNGTWTVVTAAEAGFVASNGDQIYKSLSEALAAAESGDTVALMADCAESVVMVPAGVILDLNGCVVEAGNVLSFGAVIDTASEVGGIKIDIDTTKAFTRLQPGNNGYLPIYDIAADAEPGSGIYRFFKYELENKTPKEADGAAKFGIAIIFENHEAYKVLANTADSGVTLTVWLTWTNMSVPGVECTIPVERVREFAQKAYDQLTDPENTRTKTNYAFALTVSGLTNLGSGDYVAAEPTISTLTDVGTTGTTNRYYLP